jgi:hypothetical protein
MSKPTAYVQIEKIGADRNSTKFIDGYAWDTDALTHKAYLDARERFAVAFEQADYLVDLYSESGEMVDTFPMAELGYRSLTRLSKAA